jgi:DNA-binding response OmpR family regulator
MKKTILVVDDESIIGLLLENFLSAQYEVKHIDNGQQSLEWLELNIPDLIICDIEMPGMNGFDLLSQIRQRGFTRHTPVVMLSAKSESKERIRCYKLGAQDYLTKPFNPEELEEIVKKNLFPIHLSIA